MKRVLLASLMVALFVCVFAISVSAADPVDYDGVLYTLNSNGTATVAEGNVNCAKTTVIIPEKFTYDGKEYTVTSIAANAFSGSHGNWTGNKTVQYVTFPATISGFSNQSIFRSCAALVEVTFLGEVTNLSSYGFSGCSGLKKVNFEGGISITSVGGSTFSNCSSLQSIELPDTVTEFGGSAFYGCSSLTEFKVPSSLTTLGGKCFQNCSKITRFEFPATVTSFPQDCFHACSSLEYINVPRDCTYIGNYTFNGCSKVFIDFSGARSLTSVGSNNSWGVTTSVVFPEGFTTLNSINSNYITELVFPNSTTSVGVIKSSSLKTVVLPEGITSLGDKQFDYCSALTTVTIPKGVTSIDADGNTAFYGTTKNNLKTIIFTGAEDAAVLETVRTLLPNATIEFANHCDVYYKGVHTESGTDKDNPDTNLCYLVLCTKCGLSNTYVGNDSTHDMSTVYAYANYFANGTISSTCANEGCIYHTTPKVDNETLTPFFNELKYSTKEEGAVFGIYVEYKIDQDAIALYEKLSDKSVKYGVMAIMTSNITGNGPLNVDGTTSANYVVAADVTNTKLACTQLIITGNWAENSEIEITMLGFVTDGSELHYMGSQDGEATTGTAAGAFNAVTYKNITEEVA